MNTFMNVNGRFREKATEAAIIFTFMIGAGVYSCITKEFRKDSSSMGIEKIHNGSMITTDSTQNNTQSSRSHQ